MSKRKSSRGFSPLASARLRPERLAMREVLGQVLLVLAAISLLPVAVLLLEVCAAALPRRQGVNLYNGAGAAGTGRPTVAVLVPAHDEALGIAATVATLRAQLVAGDRILVVADNCSDDTARVARASGAEVIERRDADRRGKGYALDHGIRHLEAEAPGIVIVVDADCELHPGGLERLAATCDRAARPVQALDLMLAPPAAGLKTRIAAFAWIVKNHVRPLGCLRLGLPCQLMGTGMAFPWALISRAPLATGHIVEDMRLGLDLAAEGAPPLFCPEAKVTSYFPSDAGGIADQRSRWERGHLGVILNEGPRALWQALRRGRPLLAAMVVDLSVPPLTLLVLLLSAQLVIDGLALGFGISGAPFPLAFSAVALLILAIGLAWAVFARDVVSLREILGAPGYVLAKLPLYRRMLRRRNAEWVRAHRDEPK
jgi:glycosyltransferase involved in cell wall biosynthesis